MKKNIGNIDKNIGFRLKSLRKEKKMTQIEFAKSIQIKQATLSEIERGGSRLSADLANKISDIYGVSLDWIMKGDTNQNIDKIINRHVLNIKHTDILALKVFDETNINQELNVLISKNAGIIQGCAFDIFNKMLDITYEYLQKQKPTDKEIEKIIGKEATYIEQFSAFGAIKYQSLSIEEKLNTLNNLNDVQQQVMIKILKIIDILESSMYDK